MNAPAARDCASGDGGADIASLKPLARPHEPEPKPGSVLSGDGRRADLFNHQHYPVRALCRLCGEPIKADSFFRPFAHVGS